MFDQRHFNYHFIYKAQNDKHSAIYEFNDSSDCMVEHFDKIKELFYDEFNEYPTEIKRESAVRI